MFTKPSFPKIYTNDYRDSSYKDKELQKVKEKISILTDLMLQISKEIQEIKDSIYKGVLYTTLHLSDNVYVFIGKPERTFCQTPFTFYQYVCR